MKRCAWALVAALAGCAPAAAPAVPESGEDAPADAIAPDSPEGKCIGRASATPAAVADEPARISVKHIVVKHVDAERAPASVSRSRGEACLRAQEALDKLKGGADFDSLVGDYSDEQGAASRAGSIGEVGRDGLDPAFADAAFALDVNMLSNVVESKFGFHVILRTD